MPWEPRRIWDWTLPFVGVVHMIDIWMQSGDCEGSSDCYGNC